MIWLIGNKGMLGSEVEALLVPSGVKIVGTDRELDITDLEAVSGFIRHQKEEHRTVQTIVNCSAYTAVDRAEDEPAACFRINSTGVANLARTAREIGAVMIHISTDYVFDGNKSEAYQVTDPRSPIGVYARSKAEGEEQIERILPEHYIVRTAWLYGRYGTNFVSTMLRLFNERDELSVVDDQYGSPTSAFDLARVIVQIALSGKREFGIYHFTNAGETTWYRFADEIRRQAEALGLLRKPVVIEPIPTEAYPTKAVRPKRSVLDTGRVKSTFGIEIRPWQEALSSYLSDLAGRKPTGRTGIW